MVRECPRWSHHRLLIAPYCHLPCLCRVIYLLSYPDDLPICTQNVGCASTSFASWSWRKECNVCVWAVSQAHSIHSCKCSCPKPPLGASGVGKLVFFVKTISYWRQIYDQLIGTSQLEENIFSKVLKFKTKSFPVPFNVQFIERCGQNSIVVSDGRKKKIVVLSSKYAYLFQLNILSPLDIVSIYEVKRSGLYGMFVDNLVIKKELQVRCLIGNPTTFRE